VVRELRRPTRGQLPRIILHSSVEKIGEMLAAVNRDVLPEGMRLVAGAVNNLHKANNAVSP